MHLFFRRYLVFVSPFFGAYLLLVNILTSRIIPYDNRPRKHDKKLFLKEQSLFLRNHNNINVHKGNSK